MRYLSLLALSVVILGSVGCTKNIREPKAPLPTRVARA